MFVLPNLFTVGNIFCGFFAITLCLGDPGPPELRRAAIAIFFGSFFDMFDGRVARLTRTQSEFGVQLDSLADLATFGLAPAVLLYRWCLFDLGFWGLFIAFLYVACGALRLARFNVLAARETGTSKHFLGLPIPLAAGTVVSLVLASYPGDPAFGGAEGTAAVTFALALLMVSNVRYRAFKDMRPSRKSASVLFVLVLLFAGLSAQIRPPGALAAFFVGYIAVGLLEELLFFRRRWREVEEDDPAEDDAEFHDDEEEEEPAPVPS